MSSVSPYRLFEVFGVELEYMIADRETLAVRPIADLLIKEMTGDFVSDVENGEIAWSNELVSHVIELKTNGPAPRLEGLSDRFHENVVQINGLLEKHNAMLLPTGAHPLMDPLTETTIWPHEYNEVYSLYNRIFDCRGHGWANLQSTHLNLPFSGDAEFARLHAAIRLLLPIIPALSASTPLLDGKFTGFADARLETYRHNQEKIPVIAGKVIPEAVFSQEAYGQHIFSRIKEAIEPYDSEGILDHHFLNSRGAIARFDRGAIEIRIIDLQECPAADMAVVYAVVEVLKHLTKGIWSSLEEQQVWSEDTLSEIFLRVVEKGEKALIYEEAYLKALGLYEKQLTAGEIWHFLYEQIQHHLPSEVEKNLRVILHKGTLSTRIQNSLKSNPKPEEIRELYRELAHCLASNTMYS